jgi:folate-binding protein YgfZ
MNSLDQQYSALTEAAGIARLDDRIVVRVTGDDRVSFMHGMCTQDIEQLQPGMVAPALLLTEHAHVVADFFIYAEDDALLLEIERTAWARARNHLEKFLVADDVEFEEDGNLVAIDVEGPRAEAVVQSALGNGIEMPKKWRYVFADSTRIALIPRFGQPAYTFLEDIPKAASRIESLLHVEAGAKLVERSALDLLRLENGLARVGTDTGEKTLALEARLERAISFDKGCYIGQETVERATARGGIKKRLCGIKIDGEELPPAQSSVLFEGKEVGHLTSVLRSPRLGMIGLGILHHSAWGSGTILTIKHDGEIWRAIVR